jgi:hypothetical protein
MFDDLTEHLLSQAAVPIMQMVLFMFFFFLMIFPITLTLKDVQISQQGIFLSAPIAPSDLLLGEIFGYLPFYAIFITVVTGFFTAFLMPLGVSALQIITIVVIFILTLLCGLWIGTVIAALLRTTLGKTSKGKDIGKALSVLIAIPMVGLMYAIMGGGVIEVLLDPGAGGTLKTVLGFLPSSLGADVFADFATNPGVVTTDAVLRLGGIVMIFGAALWIGTAIAQRVYSMETTTFSASRANPDGLFYTVLHRLGGGGSFGTFFTSIFKVYGRRLQNITWLVYIVTLFALLTIFFVDPKESEEALMMGMFFLPLLAAFVASDVTLRGKETLFIYRKTPSGETHLIKAMLLKNWLVTVPIALVIVFMSTFRVPELTLLSLLSNIGLVILTVAAFSVLALGFFLVRPVYKERGGDYMLNIMIITQGSVFLVIICLILLDNILYFPLVSWLIAIPLLYAGKRRLSTME